VIVFSFAIWYCVHVRLICVRIKINQSVVFFLFFFNDNFDNSGPIPLTFSLLNLERCCGGGWKYTTSLKYVAPLPCKKLCNISQGNAATDLKEGCSFK